MKFTLHALAALLVLCLVTTVPAAAQSPARWSFGIHGGADVTDSHTLVLLGGQFGVGLTRGVRAHFAVTSVIEEPGTNIFGAAGVQWTPGRWVLSPYLGGGLAIGYLEVGPFSDSDFGWLAQGGVRLHFRNITPFAEFRMLGFSGTTSQILAGFETGRF